MRNRSVGSRLAVSSFAGLILVILAAAAAVLSLSSVIQAQTAPQSRAATPDLSGIWSGIRGDPNGRFAQEEPPLQPWAMEIYKRNRAGVINDTGLDHLDPVTFCFPVGPTRAMMQRQFQIVQLPKEVLILFEWDTLVRRIHMDGREHPENWPFGWMGHSTGRWDGDTLVVDTVGLNDRTWLDRAGTPHSDQLHVVERFRRVNPDTLEIEFLFDDPKAFTKPWGAKKVYRPGPEILEHIICEEHLQTGKYREAHWPPGEEQ
ncbi:MAG: hypothetical protein O7A06_01805 [Acidobacteria bacterium]|nr:hypothetical protein [Acidobacteriota bacterium]MCZ6489248.1 hypothetical protein [Acidobacteriota bacterium]